MIYVMNKAYKIGIAVSAIVVSTATFATNGSANIPQKEQQSLDEQLKPKETEARKTKYDFSLFKFIMEPNKASKDSVQEKAEKLNHEAAARKETTAQRYDIPRSFFMFS